MYTYKHIVPFMLCLILSLTSWKVKVQTPKEGPRNNPLGERTFYTNPLVLDGKPLDYLFFTMNSRGTLVVMAGNPESHEATKIPFRVYLRRDGMIIQKGASDSGRQLYDVDIATVLKVAQPGDDLVVDPVQKSDSQARRVIRLVPVSNLFN